MDPQKEKKLLDTYSRFIYAALESRSEDLDPLCVENLMGYGTARDEVIMNIENFKELLRLQREQSEGWEVQFNRTPVFKRYSDDGNNAIIVEEIELKVLTRELEEHILNLRISSVLGYINDQWKVVHWHGSIPQESTSEDTWHINEWRRKNEELQSLVDDKTIELSERNKELEIEAALERVRTVAMGMKEPDDMMAVCRVISDEMENVGIQNIRNIQTFIFHPTNKSYLNYQYYSAYDTPVIENIDYDKDHNVHEMVRNIKGNRGNYYSNIVEGNNLKFFIDHRKESGQFSDPLLEDSELVNYHFYALEDGALGFTQYAKTNEKELSVFKRFCQVFGLIYQRFRDIETAKAQTREAQIEAALERVRAASMAMHHSEELAQVVSILFEQFKNLDLPISSSWIGVLDSSDENMEMWFTGMDETIIIPQKFLLPLKGNKELERIVNSWRNEEKCFKHTFRGANARNWIQQLFELTGDQAFAHSDSIELVENIFGFHQYGNVGISSQVPIPEEAHQILLRFTKVFEQAYIRFLDLQKAEAQAREAQIEAALERVRAASMAMHSSGELSDVLGVLFDQFDNLDIKPVIALLTLMDLPNNRFTFRMTGRGGFRHIAEQTIDLNAMDNWKEMIERWRKAEPHSHQCLIYPKEEIPQLFEVFGDIFNQLPAAVRPSLEDYPNGSYTCEGYHKYGYLGFAHNRPVKEEEIDIVIRFAREFERVYTRFLDLKKAEAQAREAQIEAALERIRAASMAMHKSEELNQLIATVFEQLSKLGIGTVQCEIILIDPETLDCHIWPASNVQNELPKNYHIPNNKYAFYKHLLNAWKIQEEYNPYVLKGKAKSAYEKWLFQQTDWKNIPAQVQDSMRTIKSVNLYGVPIKPGILEVASLEPIEEENFNIVRRFARVFEQSFTRFLDLIKAEAQVRESEIQLALERVRARTMAMQYSNELGETSYLLSEQFKVLGKTSAQMTIGIFSEDDEYMDVYLTQSGQRWNDPLKVRIGDSVIIQNVHKGWKQKKRSMVVDLSGPTLKAYNKFRSNVLSSAYINEQRWVLHIAYFSKGMIIFSAVKPEPNETIRLLERFAGAFNQTYIRFLDLQRAEQQAREAQIEAALERVRSVSMGMHHSQELVNVATIVYQEVLSLGFDQVVSGGFLLPMKDEGIQKCWFSETSSDLLEVFNLPYSGDSILEERIKCWKEGIPFLRQTLSPSRLKKHMDFIFPENGRDQEVQQAVDAMPTLTVFNMAFFKHGYINLISNEELNSEQRSILIRFANIFEQTYTRFLDLQKAEQQSELIKKEKERLEHTLADLKATQAQLIQSEKMASLGELTAGIAHEIQNPLNFVNNFSDVSTELIDEINEELENGDIEEVKEILTDLKGNLSKINHHGKRADGIVKGMLEHSRTSSGEKVPTDLNELADEYLRLAYHGLRAKDPAFNATFETQFDPDLPNVTVIPQDIGRVLLNLINNAFQACAERSRSTLVKKSKVESDAYTPKVTITTMIKNGQLAIKVEDNGNGIPDHIKDKIFQPFFTTKPTGQGTGLGLSLSYDVIKAHGGEISLESIMGKGSQFTIKLPADIK